MLRQHSMIKNVVAYYRVRVFITLSLWSPGRASDVQSLVSGWRICKKFFRASNYCDHCQWQVTRTAYLTIRGTKKSLPRRLSTIILTRREDDHDPGKPESALRRTILYNSSIYQQYWLQNWHQYCTILRTIQYNIVQYCTILIFILSVLYNIVHNIDVYLKKYWLNSQQHVQYIETYPILSAIVTICTIFSKNCNNCLEYWISFNILYVLLWIYQYF
jgi:hypothetical protein